MFDHFRIPLFVAYLPDARLRSPQLDPMRHFGLKCLQVLAGIFRAFTAEINPLCRCAFDHDAFALAVKATFFRPAAVTLHVLKGPLETPGYHREPPLVFPRPDIYAARGTKQPADRSQSFVRGADACVLIHDHQPSSRCIFCPRELGSLLFCNNVRHREVIEIPQDIGIVFFVGFLFNRNLLYRAA
jgi:hypothetical protein